MHNRIEQAYDNACRAVVGGDKKKRRRDEMMWKSGDALMLPTTQRPGHAHAENNPNLLEGYYS